MCNRSISWASNLANWPLWCRAALRRLPSRSQVNKRLKTPSLARWIETIDAELRDRLPRGNDKVGDGKPMVVGGFSHDPDARWGKTPGDGWAKGYKLHAIIDAAAGAIEAWQITPLDAGEATVLRRDLVPDCDLRGGVTLRADANYDSNPTYRAVAAAGGRLIAPRRKPGTGLGHCPHHPDRLRAINELERTPDARANLRAHKRARNRVEQTLGHLTNLPFGLWALPNHVRRLHRVRLWVSAKILLYHLHLTRTLGLSAAA